ncbi:unnamed protein product, partial [Dovyalis caffra]
MKNNKRMKRVSIFMGRWRGAFGTSRRWRSCFQENRQMLLVIRGKTGYWKPGFLSFLLGKTIGILENPLLSVLLAPAFLGISFTVLPLFGAGKFADTIRIQGRKYQKKRSVQGGPKSETVRDQHMETDQHNGTDESPQSGAKLYASRNKPTRFLSLATISEGPRG